ncbi:MAG: hypothetical protein EXS60_00625 [Candidatus Pacebacteria bacterium]|nr:hypothetical protein [Candidatus Paceibacterota bacterium]
MHTINKNAAGFAVGAVAASLHALLALGVWLMPDVMQALVNFDMALHFMRMDVAVQPFSFGGALGLIVLTFCVGYVLGRALASIYNWKSKR